MTGAGPSAGTNRSPTPRMTLPTSRTCASDGSPVARARPCGWSGRGGWAAGRRRAGGRGAGQAGQPAGGGEKLRSHAKRNERQHGHVERSAHPNIRHYSRHDRHDFGQSYRSLNRRLQSHANPIDTYILIWATFPMHAWYSPIHAGTPIHA